MYEAIIAKIETIREHPNADRLNLTTLFGNQIVIGKEVKEGHIGVYFEGDGVLSETFCKENNLYRHSELNKDNKKVGYIEDNRRIKTIKLRSEKSDGMFMPLESLKFTGFNLDKLKVGFQFQELNGYKICEKFINKQTLKSRTGNKKNKRIKENFVNFFEHIDTPKLMRNLGYLKEGQIMYVLEKLHGTSGRSGYCLKKFNLNKFQKIINKILPLFKEKEWQTVCGSRRVSWTNFDDPKKIGYYGTNEFRKVCHDKIIPNLKKGETVYYEIVGWINESTTIMSKCNNKKIKDKDFVKKYGDETIFSYGCNPGEYEIFVYRITTSNVDGYTTDYSWEAVKERSAELGLKTVPQYGGPIIYEGNRDEFIEKLNEMVEGSSVLDSKHIREGIVLRIEKGKDLSVFKLKSFIFKLLEGIIKDSGAIDIEESQEIV